MALLLLLRSHLRVGTKDRPSRAESATRVYTCIFILFGKTSFKIGIFGVWVVVVTSRMTSRETNRNVHTESCAGLIADITITNHPDPSKHEPNQQETRMGRVSRKPREKNIWTGGRLKLRSVSASHQDVSFHNAISRLESAQLDRNTTTPSAVLRRIGVIHQHRL